MATTQGQSKLEAGFGQMSPDSKEAAKKYLAENQVTQIFESVTVGLLYHRPANPVDFVQDCLDSAKGQRRHAVKWDTFVNWTPPPNSRTVSRAGETDASKATLESHHNCVHTTKRANSNKQPYSADVEPYPPEVLY